MSFPWRQALQGKLAVKRMQKEESLKITKAINTLVSKMNWADFYFLCLFYDELDYNAAGKIKKILFLFK